MKTKAMVWNGLACSTLLVYLSSVVICEAQNFTGVGKPDILWRRRAADDTYLWWMDAPNGGMSGNNLVGYTGGDVNWKIVGVGDFGSVVNNVVTNIPDQKLDILWRHHTQDATGIWYMNNQNYVSSTTINTYPGLDWEIVGAGDFGSVVSGAATSIQDNKADIVWQSKSTGQKAIWLMNGAAYQQGVGVDYGTYGNWKVVAVADMGHVAGNGPTGTPDGKPDLVLGTVTAAGLVLQVWFFNGIQPVGNPYPVVSQDTGNAPQIPDVDRQVVGAFDFTGDGKADLLLRHITDGRSFLMEMNGKDFTDNEYSFLRDPNDPASFTWDPDWRMITQTLTNSTWRLRVGAWLDGRIVSAVGVSATRIDINMQDFYTNTTLTIKRRLSGTGSYQTLPGASGLPNSTKIWSDTTVSQGTIYDYQVDEISPSGTIVTSTEVKGVSTYLPHIENRGKVLLIVEQGLFSNPTGSFETAYAQFKQNLIGDGWTYEEKTDASRHQDPNWTTANTANVASIKLWIRNRYTADPANTKGVILIGHVTIPYSGDIASDNHGPDGHGTYWTADAYYGDAVSDSLWTQSSSGQFLNNYIPSTLELAVGRIDFARLPAFQNGDSSTTSPREKELVTQYLNKNNKFRHKLAPFPVAERIMIADYFLGFVNTRNFVRRTAATFFGRYETGSVIVGEPFRNSSSFRDSVPYVPSLWAVASGNGGKDWIYGDQLTIKFTPPQIVAANEPQSVFWFMHGSWFADFNFVNDMARSVLAKPDYALAVIPNSEVSATPVWNTERMAVGEHLGASFLATINSFAPNAAPVHRWLNIQGDHTLRAHVIGSPTLTSATVANNTVNLAWTAGQGESGLYYHVWRGATMNGIFTRITTTPSTALQLSGITDDQTKRVYMVRGLKLVSTGRGSYWTISQGAFRTATSQ